MKTDSDPVSELDLQARMQRIQDNRQMMHTYFDALFGKDLKPMLDLFDEHADFPSISFQPTGKHYEFQCCFVFHITNDKIDRVHEYFDMETVKRQLGTVGRAATSEHLASNS